MPVTSTLASPTLTLRVRAERLLLVIQRPSLVGNNKK
jgi:hypothetical protein